MMQSVLATGHGVAAVVPVILVIMVPTVPMIHLKNVLATGHGMITKATAFVKRVIMVPTVPMIHLKNVLATGHSTGPAQIIGLNTRISVCAIRNIWELGAADLMSGLINTLMGATLVFQIWVMSVILAIMELLV